MSNVLLNELSRRLPERGDVKYEMTNNSLKVKFANRYIQYAVSVLCGIFILLLMVQYIHIGVL